MLEEEELVANVVGVITVVALESSFVTRIGTTITAVMTKSPKAAAAMKYFLLILWAMLKKASYQKEL